MSTYKPYVRVPNAGDWHHRRDYNIEFTGKIKYSRYKCETVVEVEVKVLRDEVVAVPSSNCVLRLFGFTETEKRHTRLLKWVDCDKVYFEEFPEVTILDCDG